MDQYKLGEMEKRFADIIWEAEPVNSGDLVKICNKSLNWKKSTTYTMLKRLCDRAIFTNDQGVVTSLMTKEMFLAAMGDQFITETFEGSLPLFLAAFTKRNKMTQEDIAEIQMLIDAHKED